MSKITQVPTIEVKFQITINESEARALDALAGYGIKEFLDIFYKNMGKHYLEPHEEGIKEFLSSIQSQIPPILNRTDKARRVFKEAIK